MTATAGAAGRGGTGVAGADAAAGTANGRRADLDWIRVGAFALLVLYHVGMFYVTWDWHVKSPRASRALEPLMLATNPWRLLLLFVVSGAATRFLADRLAPGPLARSRARRLGLPILLSMLVIVPPQTWFEIHAKLGSDLSVADFWWRYVTGSGHWCPPSGCIVTPTWNHMWFVVYLLVYTLLAALLLRARPGLAAALTRRLDALPGWAFLVLPAAVLALLRVTLAPRFGITHALVDDVYAHAMYGPAFLLGVGLARADRLRERTIHLRWVAAAVWVVACLAYGINAHLHPGGAGASEALKTAMRVVYGVEQWTAVVAVLGFAARHLTRRGPWLATLTEAVFPVYIVHQTITIAFAVRLAPLGLPVGLEAALLVAATFGGGWATYLAVRRIGPLRPWFGLRRQAAASGPPAPGSTTAAGSGSSARIDPSGRA